MYAIILSGGKQLKVEVGQKVYVEKLDVEEGSTYEFKEVLLIGDSKVKVGNPNIEGACVSAKVLKQGLGKKLRIYKYKSKNNYRRSYGHRQPYTCLEITEIKG